MRGVLDEKSEQRVAMDEIIAEMEKGWNEKIVFRLNEYRGRQYFDLRIYYEDDEGEWKPTKKGISVQVDRFNEFKENLGKLEQAVAEKGDTDSSETP